MQELLVATNPARRKKRRTSAKQRAAAMRNLKKARSARRAPARRRRSNPSGGKRRRARGPRGGIVYTQGPKRTRRRKLNPARRRRVVPKNFVDRQVMPALVGGGGAVVNDIGYNLLLGMVPGGMAGGFVEQLRTGPMRHAGKAASALLLAWAGSFAFTRRTADQLGAGALTVVGYNVVREITEQVAPQLPLGDMGAYLRPGLGYAGAGYSPGGRLNQRRGSDYRSSGLAAYVRPSRGRPRLRGMRQLPGVEVPRQITQGNPFRSPVHQSEGYTENYDD